MKKSLLILGGTTEGAELAARAIRHFGDRLNVVTSLAGRTRDPGDLPGRVRRGGFGGAENFAAYLEESGTDWVIDATHPFAATISANARIACEAAGVERLQLFRPAWKKQKGDRWVELPDMEAAVEALPFVGRRAFITTGPGSLASLSALSSSSAPRMWFLIRLIEPPASPVALGEEGRDYTLITGKGPFSVQEEAALLAQYRINVLVSKMSGGAATRAKLDAAREAQIPVLMIARPPSEPGPQLENTEDALFWLGARMNSLDL